MDHSKTSTMSTTTLPSVGKIITKIVRYTMPSVGKIFIKIVRNSLGKCVKTTLEERVMGEHN